jgi:hypothetical protein
VGQAGLYRNTFGIITNKNQWFLHRLQIYGWLFYYMSSRHGKNTVFNVNNKSINIGSDQSPCFVLLWGRQHFINPVNDTQEPNHTTLQPADISCVFQRPLLRGLADRQLGKG